jgi:hypothetical protein
MRNHKVYLAKSHLASGLDFEYVKSNLLRIPYIEIIEYGQGFEPCDCSCLIYIHDNVTEVQEDEIITINKSVSDSMLDFISQSENGEAIAGIFIYLGKSHVSSRDCEPTTPYMVPANAMVTNQDGIWEKHGSVIITAPEGLSLLDHVSHAIGEDKPRGWEQYSRYETVDPSYAMPPIPDLELRISRGTRRIQKPTVPVNNPPVVRHKVSTVIETKKSVTTNPKFVPHVFEEEIEEEEEETEEDCYTPVEVLITGRKPRRRR